MKGVKEVSNLSEHIGYREYLKPHIQSNIRKLEKDLETGDFESIEQLKATQAALRAYKNVKSFVDKRVKKRLEDV